MKKKLSIILVMMVILILAGCNTQQEKEGKVQTGDLPPMITMAGKNYFASYMPIDELPENYVYMGEITDEEANDTGLSGCKYYANKYLDSFNEFYVYQECGAPIDENTADNTKRQWGYVRWVREGFEQDIRERG